MVVAVYKENKICDPEFIRVHFYDNSYHIEAINKFNVHDVGKDFYSVSDVEAFLFKRSPFGYILLEALL